MSDNIVSFPGDGEQPLKLEPRDKCDPSASLQCAMEADLDCVVICGLNKDRTLFAASSLNHTADTLLLLARLQRMLLDNFSGDEFR